MAVDGEASGLLTAQERAQKGMNVLERHLD